MITIYGHPASTYTRTLRMACIEVDQAHEVVTPPFGTPEHAQMHPWRKMPALQEGDVRLFETLAGLSWVDRHGAGLFPQDAALRARVLGWCSALVDYVYAPIVDLGHLAGEPEVDADALGAARATLATLEAAWTAHWPTCPSVSACELMLFPMLDYARRVVTFSQDLERSPNVSRFVTRMEARRSAQETRA